MAFTYRKELLKESALMRARFRLGDKNQAHPLLQDEEIQAFLDLEGEAEGIAQCADALAVRYAQEPDEYEDEAGVKVKWSQKVATWLGLARSIRAGIASATAAPTQSRTIGGPSRGPSMWGVRP